MSRVPTARRELVPPELEEAFDAGLRKRGGMPRHGNYPVMLYSPEACNRFHHWAEYLIKDSTLSAPVQELAMLVVAREHNCQYEWNAHADRARKAGLSDALINALRDKQPLPPLAPEQAAVINYGREYYRDHKVTKATFDEALRQFGTRGLAELTMFMGYAATLAFNLVAFEIDLPAHSTEPLLPI